MIKTGTRPRVYVSSPLRAPDQETLALHFIWARAMCLKAWSQGYLPIAPHLYFPQFLDDDDPHTRAAGISLGLDLLLTASQVFALAVPVSDGMSRELETARRHGIPVRFWSLEDVANQFASLPPPPPSAGAAVPATGPR